MRNLEPMKQVEVDNETMFGRGRTCCVAEGARAPPACPVSVGACRVLRNPVEHRQNHAQHEGCHRRPETAVLERHRKLTVPLPATPP